MRIYRFFTERDDFAIGEVVPLSSKEASHARNSLRLNSGDKVIVFNNSAEYQCTIQKLTKNTLEVIVDSVAREANDKETEVTAVICITKPQSFELILQKLTEIGIISIIPVLSDHSVIKINDVEKKMDRWNKIIIAASKQSERIGIPKLYVPMKLQDAIKEVAGTNTLFFLTEEKNTTNLQDVTLTSPISFIIGPEGGFSKAEIKIAKEAKLQFVSIGEQVLRAETAAIYVASVIDYKQK